MNSLITEKSETRKKVKDSEKDLINIKLITIQKSKSNVDLAFHQQHIQTQHKIDFDNIKIKDRADNDIKLQYKEIVHINKRKPILNKQLNSNDSYRIN